MLKNSGEFENHKDLRKYRRQMQRRQQKQNEYMNRRSKFNKNIKFALNRRSIAAVCLLESALVGKLVEFALDLITDLKSRRVSRQYSRHLDTPETWNIVAEVLFKTMLFYIHINTFILSRIYSLVMMLKITLSSLVERKSRFDENTFLVKLRDVWDDAHSKTIVHHRIGRESNTVNLKILYLSIYVVS